MGNYRGPAHNKCNLAYGIKKRQWELPIVFHNGKNYDFHLIIKSLKKGHGKMTAIPQNMERYLTFTIGQLRFIDSMQFMSTSLSELAETLTPDELIYSREGFSDPEQFKLVQQKGVYPYDYFDNTEKFNHTELPIKEIFYNKLNDKEITEEEYQHAKNVWHTFNCDDLTSYHDIYLKSDVLLLTDIFEKFRETCLHHYKLDAINYFSAPMLSWDAMLKMTDVQLELFQDPNMYNFIEAGMRGGISMISNRYARANNPQVPNYDNNKPTTYLMYYDAVNLYGWSMQQYLAHKNFNFLNQEQINTQFPVENLNSIINTINDDNDIGYILEVDLHYPPHLHDTHSDYPLAPEHLEITPEIYSPYMKKHFPEDTATKLTPNLRRKNNYIVHYRNLKLYLKLGLIVTKIHNVLQFEQSPWLKSYIDFNTECRKNATSQFEKYFFKLLINSVYGKTMENVRKRIKLEFLTEEKQILKRIAKPSFLHMQKINDDLVAVQCKIQTAVLDKPIYTGFNVLDLSKVLMYDWHYNYMMQKYSNLKLLFTDTDSLCYEIEDIYQDMKEDEHLYDFSEYPFDHPLYSTQNKKKIGKMKDELNPLPLQEFIGLRAKCYSLLFEGKVKNNIIQHRNIVEKKTAKGVKKIVKDKHLKHQMYKETLNSLKPIRVSQNIIQATNHLLTTRHSTKIALGAFDTKRFILEDGISTIAHGHESTTEPTTP